ncbi:hypothetical protein L0F63_001795, partial [Massospora cicadina]
CPTHPHLITLVPIWTCGAQRVEVLTLQGNELDKSDKMPSPPISQKHPTKTLACKLTDWLWRPSAYTSPLAELAKDPKFAKFTVHLERTLDGFEAVAEWADVTAFLNKVLKVGLGLATDRQCFEAYPQFSVVPSKLSLAKRLAQCLNPALPTGVHQRALSVYARVFQTIGADNLASDLPLYAYGLFPFMQHASMSIKPQLLAIYEKHILKLGQTLRPCTKSLLLALLPGIEEEGNEYFEGVLLLLDLLCRCVGQSHYFQSLWLTLLDAPKARLPALHYLSRRFPSLTSLEDVAFVLGDDSGLMVQALCASLEDREPLVKRGSLDLLVRFLSLQSRYNFEPLGLKRRIVAPKHLTALVTSVLSVFLFRDMSLNRRAYAWGGESPDAIEAHVVNYALGPIGEAIQGMLRKRNPSLLELQRPYDILIALSDKPELGSPLLNRSLGDLLKTSFSQFLECSNHQDEVLGATSRFLETVDQYVIWAVIYKDIKSFTLELAAHQDLEFYCFVIKALLLSADSVEFVHLQCFIVTLLGLIKGVERGDQLLKFKSQIIDVVKLSSIALSKLPKDIFLVGGDRADEFAGTFFLMELIDEYYHVRSDVGSFSEVKLGALSSCARGKGLFRELAARVEAAVLVFLPAEGYGPPDPGFQLACGLLRQLTSFPLVPYAELHWGGEPPFQRCATSLIRCCLSSKEFPTLSASLLSLVDLSLKGLFSPDLLTNQLLYGTLDRLWGFLHPIRGVEHTGAVELVWSLGQVFPLGLIEGYVARKVSAFGSAWDASNLESFGWFWRLSADNGRDPAKHFSRPLLVIVDALSDESVEVKLGAQAWVRSFLHAYSDLFDAIVEFLINKEFRRIVAPKLVGLELAGFDYVALYETAPDLLQAEYLLATLLNLTRSEGIKFIHTLETTPFESCAAGTSALAHANYLIFFVQAMAGFLATELSPAYGPEKVQQGIKLYCTIGQLLQRWLASLDPSSHPLYPAMLTELLTILKVRMAHFIVEARVVPQVELLPVLAALQALPRSAFLPIDGWRGKLDRFVQLGFYPLSREAHGSTGDVPSVPRIISSLVLLSINELDSSRALPYWCDLFISLVPACATAESFQEIVAPVLEGTLERLQSACRGDIHGLIDLACQIYVLLSGSVVAPMVSARVAALLVALAKLWPRLGDAASGGSGPRLAGQARESVISTLHRLSTHFSNEFHAACVEAWLEVEGEALFVLLAKAPSFSPATFFQECLRLARTAIADSRRANLRSRPVTDLEALAFLEALLSQWHAAGARRSLNSAWAPVLNFYKDTLYNLTHQKYLLYPLLRLYYHYCLHAGAAELIADRKLRREAQDTLQKLLDQLLTVVCRPLDHGSWLKLPAGRGAEVCSHGGDPFELKQVSEVMGFLDEAILPKLQEHLVDGERAAAFLSNLVYYFIGPSLRHPHPCYAVALGMLRRICGWECAFRCWKREAWEAFFDASFFTQDPLYFKGWVQLMRAALAREGERLPEVVARVSTAPPNLFTSREAEASTRAGMLRRLSFLIFCGAKDSQVVHLPLIQEKLVELIKSGTPVVVQVEVFLCLRVLLCRFSTHRIANFWPVLLTELVQIFQSVGASPANDDPLRLDLMLSVCKFLDTVITFQVEEFQIYQWLFVNETLGAVSSRGDHHSMLDQLGTHPATGPREGCVTGTRRPLLKLRRISSLQDLQPFLNSVSSAAFSNTYHRLPPDVAEIERLILRDFHTDAAGLPSAPDPPNLPEAGTFDAE